MQEDRCRRADDLRKFCTSLLRDLRADAQRSIASRYPVWRMKPSDRSANARPCPRPTGSGQPAKYSDQNSRSCIELIGRTIRFGPASSRTPRGPNALFARGSSKTQLRVNMRNAAGQKPHREAIHDDVMVTRIPEEQIVGCLEQSKAKQRSVGRIDRPRKIGSHPRFGCGARVRFRTDIDGRQATTQTSRQQPAAAIPRGP